MASGATLIGLTSHGGVAALVVGGLFQDAYEKQGLEPENLSRTLGDSITMVDPLLPWTVSGLFMATTLGVPTLEYLPWAVFCVGGIASSFLISLTYSKTGIGLRKLTVYPATERGDPNKEPLEA
jgi:NhaC family Na+:H+ antiporter